MNGVQLVLLHLNLQLLRDLERREKNSPPASKKASIWLPDEAVMHKPWPVWECRIETFPGRAPLGAVGWKGWMAPAHLAGHSSPMQEKGAEPPAEEDGTYLGRPGMETFACS